MALSLVYLLPIGADAEVASVQSTTAVQAASIFGRKIARATDADMFLDPEVIRFREHLIQVWETFKRKTGPYGIIEFRVLPSGEIRELKITTEGTEADNFFYEQAIWESTPVQLKQLQNSSSLSEPRIVAFKIQPLQNAEGGYSHKVLIHLIPSGVLISHPDLFSKAEIEDKTNCYTFDLESVQGSNLQAFRNGWTQFWIANPNPLKQQILDKSEELGRLLKPIQS
jgi:hypothetical protein